jgi:hypothetical protein
MFVYVLVFSVISLILSVFVILFIFYQRNLRIFDQLSLHLAFADLFTTIPTFFSKKYFEPSSRCQYQVYFHQFGMINKAIVILSIATLVVSIVKTARLPGRVTQKIGYPLWFLSVVTSMTLLITFRTASIYCDDEDAGHITEIYHEKPKQLLIYLFFYSLILVICGIGSVIMLLYIYFQISSVWVQHETFHRSNLRFLIQRLRWYPIVFLAAGIPQILFVLIILISNKKPQVLLALDLLATPFLGISLSLVYIYWTLHTLYQQLFNENHPEATTFSSYYDSTQRSTLSRNSSLPNPNDCISRMIIAFLFCIHYLISPKHSRPINDDLNSQQEPISYGHNSTTSSQQTPHPRFISETSSPLSSVAPSSALSINPSRIPPSSLNDLRTANEIRSPSSFSFKNRLLHSSGVTFPPPSHIVDHEMQAGGGSRYHPTRVSLLDHSLMMGQSFRENECELEERSSLQRTTESHPKESISLSFLMNLTSTSVNR